MALKYPTLADLIAGVKAGEIGSEVLWLDNDQTDLYTEADAKVFSMHPGELLQQALTLLGVPFEYV